VFTPSREAAPEKLTVGRAALLAGAWVALLTALSFGVGRMGLVGPDEPRYAFIGRHMAESGDYLTPRLWTDPPGAARLEPWFEKPPFTYWLVAAGFRAGLPVDVAPRLPVVLYSFLFLVLYWVALRRLEGAATATIAALILATSAGWAAFSIISVTDLPLAASFNAALLLGLLRLAGGPRWLGVAAGACFGLALLAKGLVAGVLALPLMWFARRAWREAAWAAVAAGVVALPWYTAMALRHGWPFFEELFVKHHFSRFASGALQHTQPFWFYVPVLLGLLYPWTPLVTGLAPRLWRGTPRRVWAATLLFGFVFFSASANKLPGYLLPLFPSLAALLAVGVREAAEARRALPVAGLLLALAPVAASALPDALLVGLRRAEWGGLPWEYVAAAVPVAALAWWLEGRARRVAAVAVVAAGMAAGIIYIQLSTYPVIDQVVSSRALARRVMGQPAPVCVERLHRAQRYGLNYYLGAPLPECAASGRPLMLDQASGGLPTIAPR
jgi:4-amino-4-deoxy-L-arabinose transferase-like glycosyltransferase